MRAKETMMEIGGVNWRVQRRGVGAAAWYLATRVNVGCSNAPLCRVQQVLSPTQGAGPEVLQLLRDRIETLCQACTRGCEP